MDAAPGATAGDPSQAGAAGGARLIAIDWGTSSLRAALVGDGGALLGERRRPWGIQHLPEGGFAAALRGVAGDWIDAAPDLPLLACGMVGSAQGWAEAPYVPVPADADAIACSLCRVDALPGVALHVVPGVCIDGARPDVMRGEETQAVGALVLHPALAARSTLVLPGTHSKWVRVRAGRVEDFHTYLTGELYALLAEHSIVGRPAREAGAEASDEAFDEGLAAAQGDEPLAGRLFSVRARVLRGALPAAHSLDYLSGLLIGDELRAALAHFDRDAPLALVGEPALAARYRRALALAGRGEVPVVEGATVAGLWRIALRAGLVR